ncbi:leucine-rich_repeat domain-containing protein [Hexamita inflata]|uniref:Leucine-rich_repeat domain-containing protein n=1 Tax=Hexamita inflata TaxID=28002 RepID=A0ABP1GFP6_9EUKA
MQQIQVQQEINTEKYDEFMIEMYQNRQNNQQLIIKNDSSLKYFSFVDNLGIIALMIYNCCDKKQIIQFDKVPKTITNLGISDCKLDNIQGLDQMTQLAILDLQNNKLCSIESLKHLQGLNNLQIRHNQLKQIKPLATMINLISLNLSDNMITDLSPLQYLIKLQNLELTNNLITNLLPLKNLIDMQHLNLMTNNFENVDYLANMQKLKYLNISHNQVIDVSHLSQLNSLTQLILSNNNIVYIQPLEKLSDITSIEVQYNKILDMSALQNNKYRSSFITHSQKNPSQKETFMAYKILQIQRTSLLKRKASCKQHRMSRFSGNFNVKITSQFLTVLNNFLNFQKLVETVIQRDSCDYQ